MKQRLAAMAVGLVAAAGPVLLPASPARADVIRDDEWHLRYLAVAEANRQTRGEGVTVAIVDRGVDATHEDLTGSVLDPVYVRGTDQRVADPDGHGTALAGAIAGHGHGDDQGAGVLGVAPGVKVLPVVVDTPIDRAPSADELADGVELAVEQKARVIVVGYSVAGSDRLAEAIRAARAADAMVVAADGDQPSRDFEPYPAAYEGVLAAVPLSRAGDVRVRSTSGRRLGLGVPGFQIMTTNTGNRYRVDDGSASPGLLAGAVALVRAAYPDATSAQIVRRLTLTAIDAGAKGIDPEYGLGRLDLVQALTRRLPEPSPSPSPSRTPAGVSQAAAPVAGPPPPPRSRGGYGWLLGLPLLAVVLVLAGYAAAAERRIRISGRDEVDSVSVQS
ncbi:S8 family serine peptidase [Dactylosporangium sp. NPDC051485]|uniref:S8 family serine peptidase n=1 Tax=Dactylosporangium sp. NPDC051485 TaxID=3154846 RepID=UPI003418D6D2